MCFFININKSVFKILNLEVFMRKIFVLFASLSLLVVFVTNSSFASNVGCGLGAVVMQGKKGKLFELLATTTNGTFGSQTFAISSGTSGYKEGAVIGMNDVEIFIAKNMDSLAVDIARGEGEYVDTLASIMKVSDTDNFKLKLKTNFDKIYPASGVTSKEVVKNINDIVQS